MQARLNAHNISETEMNELSEEQIALEREFGAVKSKVDELGRSIAMRETDIEQLKYAVSNVLRKKKVIFLQLIIPSLLHRLMIRQQAMNPTEIFCHLIYQNSRLTGSWK